MTDRFFKYFEDKTTNTRSRRADRKDLRKFVEISSQHINLYGISEDRLELYDVWYKECPKAFHLLEHWHNNQAKQIVAVSIILPLSRNGEKVISTDKKTAFDLGYGEVEQHENHKYSCLLFDTLAINREYTYPRRGYIHKLISNHLYSLLGKVTNQPITFYVEPDLNSVERLLKTLKFKKLPKIGEEPLFYKHIDAGLEISSFLSMRNQIMSNN